MGGCKEGLRRGMRCTERGEKEVRETQKGVRRKEGSKQVKEEGRDVQIGVKRK
jgi:hypothetical protein